MQSLLDASVSSKIKRSIGNALALSSAIEHYKSDIGHYPGLSSNSSLSEALTPQYLPAVPIDMFNGRPYLIFMSSSGSTSIPVIVSPGRGGFVVQNGKVVFFQPYRAEDEKPAAKGNADGMTTGHN